jgi:hypothetical protein
MSDVDRERTLRRYLLGTLPEEDCLRLEQDFLRGDDLYTELMALEDELHHDYARGGLEAAERARFEERFLRSSEGRRKVEDARALGRALEAPRPAVLPRPKPPLWLPLAASLLLALGVAAWIVGRERPAPVAVASPIPPAVRPVTPAPAPRLVTLALASGLTRGASAARRVALAADVDRLRLVLPLDAPPRAGGYHASIVDADGREAWSSTAVLLANPATGQLDVELAADALPEGDYEVVLRAAGERPRELAAYAFTVLRAPAR